MKNLPLLSIPTLLRDRAGRKDFWIITFITLVLVVLAVQLCAWQLRRASQKQQLQTQLQQVQSLQPWRNAQLLQKASTQPPSQDSALAEVRQLAQGLPAAAWLYQPVQLQGQWLPPQYAVYLENRQMQGKTGFWVYQPFALQDSAAVIWVLRGWVSRDMRARNAVAPLVTPSGLVLLQGQLQGQPSALPSLGVEKNERTSTGAALRLNMDWPAALQIAEQESAGQKSVLPFTVRETDVGQNDGLGRNWDAPPLGIAKHQGYAFQWAGLGLSLLLLYLWFQWWQPWRRLRALGAQEI